MPKASSADAPVDSADHVSFPELGPVLRAVDIAKILHIEHSAVRRRMVTGELGRIFRVGRRMFILRYEFERAIAKKMGVLDADA